jgi:hypothetical protein
VDPDQIEQAAPVPSAGSSEPAPDAGKPSLPLESSPRDEEKKSLLEAVVSAVDPKRIEDEDAVEKPASPSAADPSPAEGAQSPDPATKPNGKDDVSDDALLAALEKLKSGDVPLNKIERFREVLHENRQLKATNERYTQLDQTLTDIGNDARRVGLTDDELAQLFSWPRLLAKDPHSAVEALQAFSARWMERVGTTLPGDLKQKVDDGVLDEGSAKEIAQLRASKTLSETRSHAEEEERQHQSAARAQSEIVTSVNAYQDELRRSDPDYTPEKHAMVVDALTSLVAAHGRPTNVSDARLLAKKAYDTVNVRLASLRPAPRQVQSPTVGRRLTRPAESQPKTMLEAITLAIGGE